MLVLFLLLKLSVSNVYEDKLEEVYAGILGELCENVDYMIENSPVYESIKNGYISNKRDISSDFFRNNHNFSYNFTKIIALAEFEKIPACLDWVSEITDVLDESGEYDFSLYEHTEFLLNCDKLQSEFKKEYINKYISCFENYDESASVN